MNKEKLKILVVDDNEDDLFLTCEYLSAIDTYDIAISQELNYRAARKKILQDEHDVYIIDYLLGADTGLELIRECTKAGITKPFILLTGKGDRQVDLDAAKAGVYDYLTKSQFSVELLERSLRYSLSRYAAFTAIEESEKRYREIFSKSNDIILVLDKHFNFLNYNPALTKLLGYGHEELIHTPLAALFEDKAQASRFLHFVEFSGSDTDHEIILLTKGGGKKAFLASFSRITSADGVTRYQGILHDYTNLKKSVAEKLLTAKIEASSKLVHSLAHEIRNPLTNINLAIHQLKEDLSEDKEVYTEIIERNSTRINDLIVKLMNLNSPLENGSERMEIKQIIQSSLSNAMDRIRLKKIDVCENHTDEKVFITGDKMKMQIATGNIIINAIEAMEAGKGKLSIETLALDDEAIIRISDNGVGIAPENIVHLFQPFYTGKKNGMGIGLAITHSVIKAHNGNIEVDSEPGKGTTFTIRLKAEPVAISNTVSSASPAL